jgi:hypothetical protein
MVLCWTTDSVYVLDIVVAVSVQFFDCRHSIFAYVSVGTYFT